MYICSGKSCATSSRLSCCCVVPVITKSHSPFDTNCRLDFHCEGLFSSDSIVCVSEPASAIICIPRSASSKNPRSPSGPETTETTDGRSPPPPSPSPFPPSPLPPPSSLSPPQAAKNKAPTASGTIIRNLLRFITAPPCAAFNRYNAVIGRQIILRVPRAVGGRPGLPLLLLLQRRPPKLIGLHR